MSIPDNVVLQKRVISKVDAVQVRHAVSNTVTEALKQTTQEEAVFFDLCSPSVRLVLYHPLDDEVYCLNTDIDMYAAHVQQGCGFAEPRKDVFICIHILK